MTRSNFTEDQIIGILKDHEAGVSVADLCRKHGVSDATVYKWKAKYGGISTRVRFSNPPTKAVIMRAAQSSPNLIC